jgi:16S rRNA (adenine1518-N6/adenine1519-N6)-dimethyltransferase
VDSAVIELRPRSDPPRIANLKAYLRIINAAFAHRRKTLRNNLLPLLGADRLTQLATDSGIDLSRRGETLGEEEFIRLADSL